MKILRISAGLIIRSAVAFLGGTAGHSLAATIHFNELSAQPADGLSYDGVTFGFTIGGVASPDASFGALGPGSVTYLQDEVLEGNANGVLALNFLAPQDHLAFGFGLDVFNDLMPGATVSLFDATSALVLQEGAASRTLIDFSEGRFVYDGAAISRVILSFDASADRFAIDNLEFTSSAGGAVPDSGPGRWLIGASLAGIVAAGTLARRRNAITPA